MTPGLDDFGAPTLVADQDDEDVYVQTIEQSVLAAVNARTSAVLGNWRMREKSEIRRSQFLRRV
jgi:hypothetical protein